MSVIETIKKRIENNPAIAQFGWLLAIVILVNSFLPSILSYSAEVWLDAPMYAVQIVEGAFKKMLFSVFEIPANTKIAAVYLEQGMTHMQHMAPLRQ